MFLLLTDFEQPLFLQRSLFVVPGSLTRVPRLLSGDYSIRGISASFASPLAGRKSPGRDGPGCQLTFTCQLTGTADLLLSGRRRRGQLDVPTAEAAGAVRVGLMTTALMGLHLLVLYTHHLLLSIDIAKYFCFTPKNRSTKRFFGDNVRRCKFSFKRLATILF
jgi:hypothetical protein